MKKTMEQITKYFPNLSNKQIEQFESLDVLYHDWNDKVNLISRKDIDKLYTNHILHSLAIAKVVSFKSGTKIMDVGTGGGFPGIPLAILFPECKFLLVDSIEKKIKVVNEIRKALKLDNVSTMRIRAEEVNDKFDFIVSRAVTAMPKFVSLIKNKVERKDKNALPNGILALKGGLLDEELKSFKRVASVYDISDFFDEDFFETKKVVHLAL